MACGLGNRRSIHLSYGDGKDLGRSSDHACTRACTGTKRGLPSPRENISASGWLRRSLRGSGAGSRTREGGPPNSSPANRGSGWVLDSEPSCSAT